MFKYFKNIFKGFRKEPQTYFPFQKFHYFIILATLFVVFYARLFTETIPIFPRVIQTADVALFLIQLLLIFLRMTVIYQRILLKIGIIFAIICVSAVVNFEFVYVPAVFSFVVFIFQPIVFFLFILHSHLTKSQQYSILIFLGITFFIQLVVGITQIPQAMEISPDRLSGTFGYNSVQMLFFICTNSFILLTLYFKKESRLFIWLSPIIITIFFMASARMIWLIFLTLLVFIYLKEIGKNLRARFPALMFFAVLGWFIYKFFNIIAIEKENFLAAFSKQFDITQLGIYKAIIALGELALDHPLSLILGTGPGTFSSRAFMTFGMNWQSQANVTATMIKSSYYSPIAVQYLLPKFSVYLGSATIAQPTSSYTSYVAEVGIIAAMLYFSIYIFIYKELVKIYKDSRLPFVSSLALGTSCGIILLFYMALFGDWFAVSRVTLFLWSIIAAAIMLYKLERYNREELTQTDAVGDFLNKSQNFRYRSRVIVP